MKLHFFDDSIDGAAACGAKSDVSTDNGLDVTCKKCRKIVAALRQKVSAICAKAEAEALFHRGYEI